MIWTVLCSGPSLEDLRPEAFEPPGPVVAVNLAIASPLPYQYLCVLDSPDNFRQEYLSRIPSGTVIWCNESKAEGWSQHGDVDPHPDHEPRFRSLHVSNPMRRSYNVNGVFVAMARAISSGASELQIFGCDMEGDQYAYALADDSVLGCVRWEREESRMLEAVEKWSVDGLSFEFNGKWSPSMK